MEPSYSPKELVALKKEHAPDATQEQFDLWMVECRNRNAVPVHDIFLQVRSVGEYDPVQKKKVYRKKAIIGSTIAFLRKIAERTDKYAGQLPSVWIYLDTDGKPTVQSNVPLDKAQPYAAQVSVLRKGWAQPVTVVARWSAYAQTYKDKDTGNDKLNPTWSTRGPEQLEKCAEALALRKAFPEEVGALYLSEEIDEAMEVSQAIPRKKEASVDTAVHRALDGRVYLGEVEISPEMAEASIEAGDAQATAKERKEFGEALRKYSNVVGSEPLRAFVAKTFGSADLKLATRNQWLALLAKLDACKTPEAMQALVNGVGTPA